MVKDVVAVANGIRAVAVPPGNGNLAVLGINSRLHRAPFLGGGNAVGGQNTPVLRGNGAALEYRRGIVLHIYRPSRAPAAGNIGHAGLAGTQLVEPLNVRRGTALHVDLRVPHRDFGIGSGDNGVVANALILNIEVFKHGIAVTAAEDRCAQSLSVIRAVAAVPDGQAVHSMGSPGYDQAVHSLSGSDDFASGQVCPLTASADPPMASSILLQTVFSQQQDRPVIGGGISWLWVHSFNGGRDPPGHRQYDIPPIAAGQYILLNAVHRHGQQHSLRCFNFPLCANLQGREFRGFLQ